MAKKKKNVVNEDKHLIRDVAMLEYVRSNYNPMMVQRVTDIPYTRVQKMWDSMTEAERQSYRLRAKEIADAVETSITTAEIDIVSDITKRLKEIGDLAVAELRERLSDDLRKTDIKDADLIAIATKCLTMVENNLRVKNDDGGERPQVTNIFNILDNSIQENIQIKSYQYEEE